MRDFYSDIVRVMDKYEVTKTNHKMCILMAWKNLEELQLSSPDFDKLYKDMSEI